MLDHRRLLRDLSFLTVASLHKRSDSAELLAFLSLSIPEVLNDRKLRTRLRQIAEQLTAEKLSEISRLLGKRVTRPSPATLSKWIEAQAESIQHSIEQWAAVAGREIVRSQTAGLTATATAEGIRSLARMVSRQRESHASAAILQLNQELIQEIAQGAGSTHYRWITTMDGRARTWHEKLNLTVQAWDKPPAGGGTRRDDRGHPGSGYGCRCVSDLL